MSDQVLATAIKTIKEPRDMAPMESKIERITLLKLKNDRLRLYAESMELRHPQGSQHCNAEVLDHLYAPIRIRDTEIRRLRNPWWRFVLQFKPVRRRPEFQQTIGISQSVNAQS
jgi:hypothetical protein